MKDLADEALVRRVAEVRDEGALSELYDRYAAVILGAGVRFLGDRGAAEDLLQDVFVSVWRSAGSFDDSRRASLPGSTASPVTGRRIWFAAAEPE